MPIYIFFSLIKEVKNYKTAKVFLTYSKSEVKVQLSLALGYAVSLILVH